MAFITTKSYELASYETGDTSAARCAVVLPGRLDSKDYVHIRSHVDALATLGFHAITFDPPGSWESPGAVEAYTITNYLAAVKEVIEYYGNKPALLVGHSLGGSIATMAAASNPHVSAYVAMMSLASEPEVMEDPKWKANGTVAFLRDFPPGDHQTAEQKQYDLPYSFFEDALKHSTRAALQTCRKPKLFILGTHDTQNAPSYPLEAHGAIADPKQLIQIDSYHGYRYSAATINQINALIKNFVLRLATMEHQIA